MFVGCQLIPTVISRLFVDEEKQIARQTAALLGLSNKQEGFNDRDAKMAMAFGELAAIALNNSRLLESCWLGIS
mgnify:CR=1 FL=1